MTRRLSFVIHALSGGGAERTLSAMASHFRGRGDAVTVVTLSGAASDVFQVDEGVTRVALDAVGESRGVLAAIQNNRRRVRLLRDALDQSRPDCVISFTLQMNVLTQLATRRVDAPTILAERADPRVHPAGRAWRLLQRWTYPRCSALVVQSEDSAAFFRSFVPPDRIHRIPNGVAPPAGEQAPRQASTIVGVGRLDPQKGFDLLVDAFARVANSFPGWSLVLYGDGDERPAITAQIQQLGLVDRVRLAGWTNDPWRAYQSAALFVLPSRSEGFPNALLEAMASGAPSISFRCPNGPEDIIDHQVNGLLAPPEDVDALAQAMAQLMSDERERERLGEAGRDVLERFGVDAFYARWDELIERTIGAR